MSIEVSNLSKHYNEQKAVDAISFSVRKGEILGFLGPNGAGKSTTMKMLTAYIPPTSGTATICGYDIVKQELEVKKCIGYLPENNPLYYDMYVREFLEFVGKLNTKASSAVIGSTINDIIGMVGLTPEKHKKIGQLSRGYKQRVGLAQALLHNPEILILDEPTSGLDPNQLADIRQLIIDLGKEKTILFSTHIMQEVQAVCDRVVIINKGKIVADATPENLQQTLSGSIQVEVEFEHSEKADNLKAIDEVTHVQTLSDTHFILQGIESIQLRKNIFAYAVQQNNTLLTIKEESKSLEDVFHELTK